MAKNNKDSVWVIIPAYNEEQVIEETLNDLITKNGYTNIVLVDDGSQDNTIEIASKFNIHILRHIFNLGQGASLVTGFEYALKYNPDYLVTYDADGQMQASDIDAFIDCLENDNIDIALGSRFLGSEADGMPIKKVILLWLAVLFTRSSTGLAVTDTHNGFRALKLSAARRIDLRQNKMAHSSEFLTEIVNKKFSYKEIPVTIKYTNYSIKKGQSVFGSFKILLDMFTGG